MQHRMCSCGRIGAPSNDEPENFTTAPFGAGISGGAYKWSNWTEGFGAWGVPGIARTKKTWDHALWANLTLSLEGRTRLGFSHRLLVGHARMLNPGSGRCNDGNTGRCLTDHVDEGKTIPVYFAFVLGWAF